MQNAMILVVDDNEDVRQFVRVSLEQEGFQVTEAVDGNSALAVFEEVKPAVVILDLTMGQPDGFEVCREIRKVSNVPIIMLTVRSEELDEAMCLAAGADDYITKPVSARILALRVTTQLRHINPAVRESRERLAFGPMELNLESRELIIGEAVVSLTRTEFDFLRLLMEQPKRVFTRDQIIEAIGGSQYFGSDHLLDTHASRLRIKIRTAGGPNVISAVRSVGYRLSATAS